MSKWQLFIEYNLKVKYGISNSIWWPLHYYLTKVLYNKLVMVTVFRKYEVWNHGKSLQISKKYDWRYEDNRK